MTARLTVLLILALLASLPARSADREATAALAAAAARQTARADSLAAAGRDAELAASVADWLAANREAHELTWPLRQRLGLALLRLGRHDEAVAELERTVLWAPGVAANHRNLARALLAAGKRGRAFGEYREALDLAPDDADVRAEYAHVLIDFGQAGRAAAVLGQGRDAGQASPALDRAEARLHLERGDPAAALPALERLHAADPADGAMREQLALARLRAGEPESARLLLLDAWPEDLSPMGRRLVLEADRLLGDGVRARGLADGLDDSLAVSDPDLLALASLICYDLGEDRIGLDLIDRVIALMPGQAAYRNNRVAFLLRLGRREEADREWARVLELDPSLAGNRTEEPADR